MAGTGHFQTSPRYRVPVEGVREVLTGRKRHRIEGRGVSESQESNFACL